MSMHACMHVCIAMAYAAVCLFWLMWSHWTFPIDFNLQWLALNSNFASGSVSMYETDY